jgi:hypothetical protein
MNSVRGWKTIGFGLVMVIVPPALTYLGGIDWTTLGIHPGLAAAIGVVIMALRAATSTAVGRSA